MEKNTQKSERYAIFFAVLSKLIFLVAVLLFHYPYSTAKASLEVHGSQLPEFLAIWMPPKIALLRISSISSKVSYFEHCVLLKIVLQ